MWSLRKTDTWCRVGTLGTPLKIWLLDNGHAPQKVLVTKMSRADPSERTERPRLPLLDPGRIFQFFFAAAKKANCFSVTTTFSQAHVLVAQHRNHVVRKALHLRGMSFTLKPLKLLLRSFS